MSFQYNTFSIWLLMTGVASLLLALLIFQRRGGAVRWFALMMMCIVIWAICYGFELASYTLGQMLFWINLEYIGISFLPSAWIIFMIRFIGKEEWLTRRNQALIFLFPVLTLFFVWTNQWHHIHYQEVSLDDSGPFPLLSIRPGPWYRVHTVYFYFMLVWGVYLLVRKFQKADAIFKKQNRIILVGAFIPWVVNFLYLLGIIRPHTHIDLTPYAFILTSTVIGIGLLRFKLFDIVPLAREKVIDGMNDGMLVLDSQGRVIDLNPAMRKFLPAGPGNPVGRPLNEVLPVQAKIQQSINERTNDRFEIELPARPYNRFFEVAITSLFEKTTIYSGTLLLFWDITGRKRAENKLREKTEELNKLNRLKDRIFSIISHDLRSPLAGLISILNIIEEGEITEQEFRAYAQDLSRNVGYTSVLLENLLYWSTSQLEGEKIVPETFDLKAVVKAKLLLFERRAREKNIRMEDFVVENTVLHADIDMVKFILRNLISNAIKFCRSGDKITLWTQHTSGMVTVCVSDTGVGLTREVREQLFGETMITRLGTKREKGTGLGLKLCKEFVEKNNGRIWVKSAEGRGSTFYFSLAKGQPEYAGAAGAGNRGLV